MHDNVHQLEAEHEASISKHV